MMLLPEALGEIERLRAENAKLLAFVGALMAIQIDSDFSDLDGADLDDLLVEHGLRAEATATADDCAEKWAQEYGVEEGDTIRKDTDLGKRALAAHRRSKDA